MDTRLLAVTRCGLAVSLAVLNGSAQNPVIYLERGDAGMTSSLITGGAKNWSDKQDPHPGADYLVETGPLRTPENNLDHTFPGDSLTIRTTAGYMGMKGRGLVTVNDLRFESGGKVQQSLANDSTVRLHATCTMIPSTPLAGYFDGMATRVIVLTGAVLGSGEFRFAKMNSDGNTGVGLLHLDADLSGFEGTWAVENPTPGDTSRLFETYLSANDNIGSTLGTFRPDALKLINGGALGTTGTVSISAAPNRGITLQNDGAFNATNSTSVLTLGMPIAGTGHLFTRGAGRVELDGPLAHDGDIRVTSGTLRLCATNDAYSGKVNVNNATLQIRDERNLGCKPPPAPFSADHLTLATNGTLQALATLTISNDWRGIRIEQQGFVSVAAPDTLTLATPISGDSLTKAGTGMLALAGNSTYAGTTLIADGTLTVESVTGLGDSALSFAPDTTLRVAYPCPLANGFHICGATPLTIDDRLTLHIEAAEEFPSRFVVPLFFVEEGAETEIPFPNIIITTTPPLREGYAFTYLQTPITHAGNTYTAISLECRFLGTIMRVK